MNLVGFIGYMWGMILKIFMNMEIIDMDKMSMVYDRLWEYLLDLDGFVVFYRSYVF